MHVVVLYNCRNDTHVEVKVLFDTDKFDRMFLDCLATLGYIKGEIDEITID